MKTLNFEFKKLVHPYSEEPSSSLEMWGMVRLISKNDNIKTELINSQWNLLEVFELFDRIKNHLLDPLPFKNDYGYSIAELRDSLFSVEDFDSKEKEDEYFDQIEDYFSYHTIKLRGTATPLYYIGINNSSGEISRYDKLAKKYIAFNFDMEDFLDNTEELISRFRNIQP